MSLLSHLRERVAARQPVSMCTVPSWSQSMPSLQTSERAYLRELNKIFADQVDLLRNIHAAWERGDFTALNRCLNECAAYFDPDRPHLLVYFVGLGGIDLFVSLLCDVNTPTLYAKQATHFTPVALDAKSRVPWDLSEALHSLMRVLTELLVCHNELGWYYYDRYPGVFFQLLELARNSRLRHSALVMLEHLVLSVGPVLEIAKLPLLQELLRTSDDASLAILCRVIALLIVPGSILGQHDSPRSHSAYPESILPLQRVQRVIDSNVLWLIGEKGFVQRLVRLCEVVDDQNDRGNRFAVEAREFVIGLPVPALQTPAVAPFPSLVPNSLMDTFLSGFGFAARESNATPMDGDGSGMTTRRAPYIGDLVPGGFNMLNRVNRVNRENNSDNSSNNNSVSTEYNNSNTADSVASQPNATPETSRILDLGFALNALEDNMYFPFEDNDTEALVGSSVDFSWFVGCSDVKQRWRLRDLTLRQDIDDNRPLLCGFGPTSDSYAWEAFSKQNRAYGVLLSHTQRPVPKQLTEKLIISAQSEILFVLNLMLSTFFFGDVWYTLRECQWIRVATSFYSIAFDSHDARHGAVNREQQWQEREWHQLPRFRATNECAGPVETVYRGEDTEAYTRNAARLEFDEDEFDDSDHQHEPGTVRKLELLRGVQEFWNAQDRRECGMLNEDDTALQSMSLAKKIAGTLVKCREDSCVETSACHALEGYLRCFSFSVLDKCAAEAPQTFIGHILMRSILEHRVYNATYVPGLSGSLAPAKRIDGFFALLGELIRYHRGNLTLLQSYVAGDVDLQHLNNPVSAEELRDQNVHAASQEIENLLRLPPLDRCEYEAFGEVMLRRVYSHSCDTSLFIRSLLLSLTPGLRSRKNYVWKPATADAVDAMETLSGVARIGDVSTGHLSRLHYIRCESRRFVDILSRRRRCGYDKNRDDQNRDDQNGDNQNGDDQNGDDQNRDMTLWDMLQVLLRAPHRLSLADRPFPRLFDFSDFSFVCGSADLLPVGPPEALARPLFAHESDADGRRALAVLEAKLLGEPDRLVYSMLGPLNAERIQNAGRLCVVTTSVLVFLRVARLRGADGVHEVLRGLRAIAAPAHARWARRRRRRCSCERGEGEDKHKRDKGEDKHKGDKGEDKHKGDKGEDKHKREKGEEEPPLQGKRQSAAGCAPSDGSARCTAFLTHGDCAPQSASEIYYQRYGGCFFRNMFRLMCVWIGHYGACQRYIETLYYCTEVPFAESKSIVLYLMRILPDYFF